MDFTWTNEQRSRYDEALRFAREELASADIAAAFRRAAGLGITGACISRELGGAELGALDTALVLEALGRGAGDVSFPFALAAHLFACVLPIARYGSAESRRELLPALCRGDAIGGGAITEAEAGSDVFAMTSTAARDGDTYVLEGEKAWVTNAPIADVLVVYARTAPADGFMGISAFALERRHGFVAGDAVDLVGLRAMAVGSARLGGCIVPASSRLGNEGDGAKIFRDAMAWERACLFAAYVGAMDRQIEDAIHFVKERRQGRRTLAQHQAVVHRIADMKVRLEGARMLVYRACCLLDRGEDADLDASIAKIAVSEAALQSGLDAIHLRGGLGLLRDGDGARALCDALPARIVSGTTEIQKNLVGRGLGL